MKRTNLIGVLAAVAISALMAPTAGAYYDSAQGRFISRDPIGYQGGWNLYEYVRSVPTRFLDPTGLVAVGDIEIHFTNSIYGFWSIGVHVNWYPPKNWKSSGAKCRCQEVTLKQIAAQNTHRWWGGGMMDYNRDFHFDPTGAAELQIWSSNLPATTFIQRQPPTVVPSTPIIVPGGPSAPPVVSHSDLRQDMATLVDNPGYEGDPTGFFSSGGGVSYHNQWFETCAVCTKSGVGAGAMAKGEVLGCVQWFAHTFSSPTRKRFGTTAPVETDHWVNQGRRYDESMDRTPGAKPTDAFLANVPGTFWNSE